MPRPSQYLHPARPPAPARAAATVLLLRDTPDSLEVLMTRRSSNASFVLASIFDSTEIRLESL